MPGPTCNSRAYSTGVDGSVLPMLYFLSQPSFVDGGDMQGEGGEVVLGADGTAITLNKLYGHDDDATNIWNNTKEYITDFATNRSDDPDVFFNLRSAGLAVTPDDRKTHLEINTNMAHALLIDGSTEAEALFNEIYSNPDIIEQANKAFNGTTTFTKDNFYGQLQDELASQDLQGRDALEKIVEILGHDDTHALLLENPILNATKINYATFAQLEAGKGTNLSTSTSNMSEALTLMAVNYSLGTHNIHLNLYEFTDPEFGLGPALSQTLAGSNNMQAFNDLAPDELHYDMHSQQPPSNDFEAACMHFAELAQQYDADNSMYNLGDHLSTQEIAFAGVPSRGGVTR